jgi:hypothetical protein
MKSLCLPHLPCQPSGTGRSTQGLVSCSDATKHMSDTHRIQNKGI